jgi:hypothetical protein
MRLIALLGLAAALIAFGVFALQRRYEDVNRAVEAQIGETRFRYAAVYARDEATASGGRVDRLAFAASFPDFSAPFRASKPGVAPRPAPARENVFVTLAPKDDGIDPAERPEKLYARFLEGDAWAGPGGLIMRRFEQNSPYDLEQLYVAPQGAATFFARCPRPQPASAAPTEQCLSLFRVEGIDVELRYSAALLDRWDALADGAREFIGRLRPPQKRGAR